MPVETRRRTLVETTTLNVPDDEGPLTKLKKSPKSPADTLRLKQEVTPTGSSNANSRPIVSSFASQCLLPQLGSWQMC